MIGNTANIKDKNVQNKSPDEGEKNPFILIVINLSKCQKDIIYKANSSLLPLYCYKPGYRANVN